MAKPTITRRVFLSDLGRAAVGVSVLGLAACSSEPEAAPTTSPPSSTAGTTVTTTTAQPATSSTTEPPPVEPADAAVWERVQLGSVSAYVVVRAGEAVVVDTGNGGSAGAIEEVLTGLGVGWEAVGHIVVTHDHPDHQGSLGPAMEAAPGATGYAGALDIPDLSAPRAVEAVGDGDSVLGIDVIETPGHTPGHISLIDPELSLLIAGDALVGDAGGVGGPIPRFTNDLDLAIQSVVKLGGLAFDAAVFGHGEPVLSGASQLVAELGPTL